ncbi:MAG: pyridoxamine 5'-phosphate oxidase family protein [Ardenticatenaceae bacterium]|nr:pyridoxamine 5'-phosphate oxidase family protein [Anaerolineales bacterium]MCB8923875.1 pyridoxamine 5'-phosphate oxidase family protein [Ardenticatenaceae bacterium]MCB8990043.1 pyridoxamine 5'-phosphate oxidase family protein [Ardenticatenaceae bacterium]
MQVNENWAEIKQLFRNAFRSSFHYAIATVNENGEPHITPIGSLILGKPGHGVYFEEFPSQLPRNLKTNQHVCVLAVNSDRWFWLKSLIRGRFAEPPAVRLYGTVGEVRPATPKEIQLWQRRVKPVSFTKGHAMMWRQMSTVRDIAFSHMEPVRIGDMTHNTWNLLKS